MSKNNTVSTYVPFGPLESDKNILAVVGDTLNFNFSSFNEYRIEVLRALPGSQNYQTITSQVTIIKQRYNQITTQVSVNINIPAQLIGPVSYKFVEVTNPQLNLSNTSKIITVHTIYPTVTASTSYALQNQTFTCNIDLQGITPTDPRIGYIQWQINTPLTNNFTDIPDASGVILTFKNTIADGMFYLRCKFGLVRFPQSTYTSNDDYISLTLNVRSYSFPTITYSPTLMLSQSTTFIADATPNLTSQWYVSSNGTSYNSIDGETSTSITYTPSTVGIVYYKYRLTSTVGFLESSPLLVTTYPAPYNTASKIDATASASTVTARATVVGDTTYKFDLYGSDGSLISTIQQESSNPVCIIDDAVKARITSSGILKTTVTDANGSVESEELPIIKSSGSAVIRDGGLFQVNLNNGTWSTRPITTDSGERGIAIFI